MRNRRVFGVMKRFDLVNRRPDSKISLRFKKSVLWLAIIGISSTVVFWLFSTVFQVKQIELVFDSYACGDEEAIRNALGLS